LKEIRAERVGVIGLSGLVRAPEGVVPWGTFEKIRTSLPKVSFENATDLMQEVRSVKSAEEVAFIEKAAEIIGYANEVLIAHAKPGVGEHELVAEMLREIVRRGGEPITMMLFGTGGPEVPWAQRVFTERKLKVGDLINTEVEAKYAGYIAQALQPVSLGPKPKELEKIFDTTKAIFDKMLKLLKPGLAFGTVAEFYREEVQSAGYEPDGALMHGRGLGEDAPMLWGARHGFPEKDAKLRQGHVFILKPACRQGFMRDSIRAGDTVAIDADGARRLGKRELTFIAV
jgi:Xaa-Pro dipeptidase